jgi:hypothetical protein
VPRKRKPVEIFYSYSHRDEKLRDKLHTHLAVLERGRLISEWHDRKITAGDEWKGRIDERLKSAAIILLLVSPDFVASDYCYDVELRHALKRHRRGDARVIPIILRPCEWKFTPFAALQSLPTDGRPITTWTNRDKAFLEIANGIRKAVLDLAALRPPPPVRWIVEIKAQLNEFDQKTLDKILVFLRNQTGDRHLALLRVEKGSVKLVLEGSESGFHKLWGLFKRGSTLKIFDFEILAIQSEQQSFLTEVSTATQIISSPFDSKISALHQLPPSPVDFIGRVEELNELLFPKGETSSVSTVVHGMHGVGKTALALKVANQVRPKYPDAQFFLDLKGMDQNPWQPVQAMTHIIRAFVGNTQLPERDEGRRELYLSVLQGKRVLLLMDNALDAQQIQPLMPPPGCLLLATSQQRVSIPGLVEMNLDGLKPQDAAVLLLSIAPRLRREKPAQIEELGRLCGFIPLALRVVGHALQENKEINPKDYIREMAGISERFPELGDETALQVNYLLLNESLRKRFRFLAIFPDTFDLKTASAIWGVNIVEAENSLADLITYSLIEFDEISRRYRLHDLVRSFANARLSVEQQAIEEFRLKREEHVTQKGKKHKRLHDPNWGKPGPIGPVLPVVTSFEQAVKEFKLTPEQYIRSTRLQEWARRNKIARDIPKKRSNPNWGKPEPIGPVLPVVTSFEQAVKEFKLTPEQYIRSTRLREWARRNKTANDIPEALLQAWELEKGTNR